jgi:hypothetical protein
MTGYLSKHSRDTPDSAAAIAGVIEGVNPDCDTDGQWKIQGQGW